LTAENFRAKLESQGNPPTKLNQIKTMKNILSTLAFYVSVKERHSYNPKDKATVRAINSLEKQGYLHVNRAFNQAIWTGKTISL